MQPLPTPLTTTPPATFSPDGSRSVCAGELPGDGLVSTCRQVTKTRPAWKGYAARRPE